MVSKSSFLKLTAVMILLQSQSLLAKVENVKISAIKAHLFYSESGEISPNIIGDKKFILWNTIIGEGSSEGHSEKTLIVVELTATKDQGNLLDRPIHIKVQGSKKTLVEVDRSAGFFSSKKFNAPILVEDTGCDPLTITAEIKGQPDSRLERSIPFACGE